MPFRPLALAAAAVSLALALTLVFAPGLLALLFGLAGTGPGGFFARRLGMLFLGYAVLLALLRDLPAGPARRAVALAVGLALAGLAATGVWAFVAGDAGPRRLPRGRRRARLRRRLRAACPGLMARASVRIG
jgi:hypothetical protein